MAAIVSPRVKLPSSGTDPGYAALSERVHSLASDVGDLKREVDNIRQDMASAADVHELSRDMRVMMQRFDERNRTQWVPVIAAVSVAFSIMAGVGWIAYMPVDRELMAHRSTFLRAFKRIDQAEDRAEKRYVAIGQYTAEVNSLHGDIKEINNRIDNVIIKRMTTTSH